MPGGSQKLIGKVDPQFGKSQKSVDTYFTNREILKYWNFHRMDPNTGDIQPYILLKKFKK